MIRAFSEIITRLRVETDPKTDAAFRNLRRGAAGTQAALNQVSNNSRKAALATRNLGYVAQNASYQVADFFVMIQGGVGVGRALATQLPQLLAGFGAWGAVLGAVAAVGASVVVMLTNQKRAAFEADEAMKKLAETTSELSSATKDYVKSGTAGTKFLEEYAFYQQQISSARLSQVFAPPEASAWRGIVAILKELLEVIKQLPETFYQFVRSLAEAAKDIPVLGPLLSEAADNMQRLREELQQYGQVKNADRDRIFDSFSELARDLDNSYIAAKVLKAELSGLSIDLPISEPTAAFKANFIFETYKKALQEAGEDLETLSGKEKELYEILQKQAQEQVKIRLGYQARLEDLVNLEPLQRMTDLEKATSEWQRALDKGFVTAKEAKDAIVALTEIDRWKPLQDIIISIGDRFENSIIAAMKAGKFAVKDFVEFALEQFARLALSRALEPFFLLLANSLPGALGGSPNPPTGGGGGGVNNGFRSMDLAPMTVPQANVSPMYTIGKNFSYIPGTKAGGNDNYNNVTVNVNNYGRSEVDVQQRETSRGVEIDVLIKDTVRSGFANGEFDTVMSASYGARRVAF